MKGIVQLTAYTGETSLKTELKMGDEPETDDENNKPYWQTRWEKERSSTVDGKPINVAPPSTGQPTWLLYSRGNARKIFYNRVSGTTFLISFFLPFIILLEAIWFGMWKYLGIFGLAVFLSAIFAKASGPASDVTAAVQFCLTALLFVYFLKQRNRAIRRYLERKNWIVIGSSEKTNKAAAIREWEYQGLLNKLN